MSRAFVGSFVQRFGMDVLEIVNGHAVSNTAGNRCKGIQAVGTVAPERQQKLVTCPSTLPGDTCANIGCRCAPFITREHHGT